MKHFTWLLFLLTFSSHAQSISGIVTDSHTNEALPFAVVQAGDKKIYTDIDGKFSIQLPQQTISLAVFYIGYTTQNVSLSNRDFVSIRMMRDSNYAAKNTAGEETATSLMRRVVFAKSRNDPEKLNSFKFHSYNKLIISANPDSIDGTIDTTTVRKFGKTIQKIDSSSYRFKKMIRKQHLFQTEVVSNFQYDGNTLKETVLGVKMSGFKQPVYELLALHLQSFSIYENTYELFETKYNGPLADDASDYYSYRLLDTVTVTGRKLSVVYFSAKRKNKSSKLQGLLYIDNESFAVAKAIVRAKGILDISAIHQFEYASDLALWFPSGKELKIVKGNNEADIRIFGETLKFDSESGKSKRSKEASDFTYLSSKSWYSDTEFNTPVTISRSVVSTHIKDDAPDKTDDFWQLHRRDTLDFRSSYTYYALDSLAKKERVEKKLFIGRKLFNGYVPLGPFDADLRYLLSYNNYEGFRFGFGGITNEQFSRKYRIEGYTAYGTKDGDFKYNLGAAARIGKFSNTWIGGAYTDDVREIASTTFAIDKRVFKLYDPRPINVSTFYNYVSWRGYIETKIIPKTESIWQLNYSRIEPKFGYIFNANDQLYSIFHMTTAMVSLQWNPFSDYMQTPVGRLESEKRFPKFTFQYTQAIPDILGNDFEFGKIDLRVDYEKKFLNGQKSTALFEAGYAYGDVPLTHLYNTSPNNLTKDRLLQRITLAGKNSFETMFFNEFFSSQYIFFQLKHGSQRIKILPKIRPSIVLVSRFAWGAMEKPQQHLGIDYKTLNQGYYESGIEVNQIYKGFGLSGFYRYGPNQLSRLEDNIAVKGSFIFNLGF